MPSRLSSLFVRGRRTTDGAPPAPEGDVGDAPPPSRVPLRPVSIQRERRELARRRELDIRDVGGLALEMVRREVWKPDVLAARAHEVLGIEERIHELDAMLAASELAARGLGAVQCRCGAPILRGAHFCSHCGRPGAETPPVVACSRCGQPLPADANFCPVCGNAVAAEEFERDDASESPLAGATPPREGESGAA